MNSNVETPFITEKCEPEFVLTRVCLEKWWITRIRAANQIMQKALLTVLVCTDQGHSELKQPVRAQEKHHLLVLHVLLQDILSLRSQSDKSMQKALLTGFV